MRALQSAEVRERLTGDGAEPVGSTPEQFAAFIRVEMAKWSKVIKAAGLAVQYRRSCCAFALANKPV